VATRDSEYSQLFADIAEEYRALKPRLAALRAPEARYLQLEDGGKAAHYEWKVLHGPTAHVEVALHFEGEHKEDNQAALRQIRAKVLAERVTTTPDEVVGSWGGKWTRYGVRVRFDGVPDRDTAQKSAQAMHALVERTYAAAKGFLERGAATGWPAA
jgi:hypothetical protein